MTSTHAFLVGLFTIVWGMRYLTYAITAPLTSAQTETSKEIQRFGLGLGSGISGSSASASASYNGPVKQDFHLNFPKKWKRETAVQQCGKRLVEAVNFVCEGSVYSALMRYRRSFQLQVQVQASKDSKPGHRDRVRRTITDECCKKPCTIMEMVKYCGRGHRRRKPATLNRT